MVGAGWMDAVKAVDLTRSRVVRTEPELLWALVSDPSAELLSAAAALVLSVPESALSCVVDLWDGRTQARLVERLPADRAWTLRTLGRSTGISATVTVVGARAGSRVTLATHCEVPRSDARQRLALFELLSAEWLERVGLVAEGFAEHPQPRVEEVLAAQRLGPATATLHARRTLAAPRTQVWALLTSGTSVPPELHRFWTGAGPLAAGHWLCRVYEHGEAVLSASLVEVTEAVAGVQLTTRTISGGHHAAADTWQLTDVPAGTAVTVTHECATSHVGLPDVVELALDRLQARLDR